MAISAKRQKGLFERTIILEHVKGLSAEPHQEQFQNKNDNTMETDAILKSNN